MLESPNRAHLPPSPWTDERVEILKRGWNAGLSCGQIAADLKCGFSRNAVQGKAFRLGLPTRPEVHVSRAKQSANNDRSATMRIKTLKVRGASNGGAQIVESVVREPDPETVEFDTAIPVGQRCTILQLTDETCRWPIGDPGQPNFFFCGGKTNSGTPYCGYHGRIAYQLPMRPVVRTYYPTARSKPAVF